jgi:hypothetical protein
MRAVKLNINDEIFDKFMGLIDILPKDGVQVEEIDAVPFYPSISFKEAQHKVKNSLKNISKNSGKDADVIFEEILS